MSRNKVLFRSLLQQKDVSISKELRLPEQLIIRVWKACNFRCVFCNVAENEAILAMKPKIKEILAQAFYRIKYSNLESGIINITISGWEPSLFQTETLFVMKYFKKYFDNRSILTTFEMQSNASNISPEFAKNLKDLWLYDVMVSYHTHDPDEYQEYIWVDYQRFWWKVNSWINNLISAGISVSFNVILSKINSESYFDHIKYLVKNFPSVLVYNIWFVQPHWMAQKNFDNLYIDYNEVFQIYNRVISYLKIHNKKVHSHLVWLPLCYMDDYSSVMEYYHNRSIIEEWPDKHTLIQKINDENKWFDKNCNRCKMKWLCSWIWKEYIWVQKVKPIPYEYYSQFKHSTDAILYSEDMDIKKVKDSWVSQIFILWKSELDEGTILAILTKLRKFNFHMISIVLFQIEKIKNVDKFYATNLQYFFWDKKPIQEIFRIITYNNKTPLQFQIKVDIFPKEKIISKAIYNELSKSINIHKYHWWQKIEFELTS